MQPVSETQQHNNPNKHPKGIKLGGAGAGAGGMGSIIITWTADEQIWLDIPNTPRSMCDYAITAHLLHQLLYKWRHLCTVVWQTLPRDWAAALKVKNCRNIFTLGISAEQWDNTGMANKTTEFENFGQNLPREARGLLLVCTDCGCWCKRCLFPWKQQSVRSIFLLRPTCINEFRQAKFL